MQMKPRSLLVLLLLLTTLAVWSLAAQASLVKFKDEIDDRDHERTNYSHLRVSPCHRDLVKLLTSRGGANGGVCSAANFPGLRHSRSTSDDRSRFSTFLCFASFLPLLVLIHIESIRSIILKF